MDNLDKFFKGQQRDEEYICHFIHHWVVLIREFAYFGLFLLIVTVALINIEMIKELLSGNTEMKLFFITAFLIGTVYLHRFFLKMLNYSVNIGIITDKRVIDHKKTLFFSDTMDSIDMGQIQNIERVSEGIFPNLLHYGDIKIFLNASNAILTFGAIPNAKFIFRCISRQKEARQNLLRGIRYERENQPFQEKHTIEEVSQYHGQTPGGEKEAQQEAENSVPENM
jgi:hypothetical protein